MFAIGTRGRRDQQSSGRSAHRPLLWAPLLVQHRELTGGRERAPLLSMACRVPTRGLGARHTVLVLTARRTVPSQVHERGCCGEGGHANTLRSHSRCGDENRAPFADATVPSRPRAERHQCAHPGSEETAPPGAGARRERAHRRCPGRQCKPGSGRSQRLPRENRPCQVICFLRIRGQDT